MLHGGHHHHGRTVSDFEGIAERGVVGAKTHRYRAIGPNTAGVIGQMSVQQNRQMIRSHGRGNLAAGIIFENLDKVLIPVIAININL